MDLQVYPLLFEPVYKHMIWGGSKISSEAGLNLKEDELPVGESWLIADRNDGQTVVSNGPHKGLSLSELIEKHPGKIVSSKHRPGDPFPLIIKIIDAGERLSLQVHPDEIVARKYPGSEAKTEMWYVLEHTPGANIYAGLRHDKTQLQFRTRIGTDKIEECLQKFPSRDGDAYYIPSGTVHAIGEGNLILEIHQNSNTTYRVYDWGRVKKDGESRELHVEQALDSIHFKDRTLPLIRCDESTITANKKRNLVRYNKYFNSEELKIISDFFSNTSSKTFHILSAVNSSFSVKYNDGVVKVDKGRSCLLPAALGAYSILAEDEPLTVIRSMLSM